MRLSLILCTLVFHASLADAPRALAADKKSESSSKSKKKEPKGKSLFDGKTLKGWKSSEYGGEGEVHVEKGSIILEIGEPITGITATGKIPRMNYEVTLEAMRVDGFDFFCGMTFPVGKTYCSLIVGGWGGGLIGVSSLDGNDASDNETGRWHKLETNKWYKIRLRVTHNKLEAWIDKTKAVDVDTTGRKISIRPDVAPSKPFGIAAFRTRAALRNIRIRKLEKSELKAAAKKK